MRSTKKNNNTTIWLEHLLFQSVWLNTCLRQTENFTSRISLCFVYKFACTN